MKNKTLIFALLALFFMLIGCFLLGSSFAHPSTKVVQMEDGEMMIITNGKAIVMINDEYITN